MASEPAAVDSHVIVRAFRPGPLKIVSDKLRFDMYVDRNELADTNKPQLEVFSVPRSHVFDVDRKQRGGFRGNFHSVLVNIKIGLVDVVVPVPIDDPAYATFGMAGVVEISEVAARHPEVLRAQLRRTITAAVEQGMFEELEAKAEFLEKLRRESMDNTVATMRKLAWRAERGR